MTDPAMPVETVSGLRTRFFPRSRIGQGLITMAPWVDAALIIVFVVIMQGQFVVQPGVVVEIPQTPVRQGLRSDLAAVILSVETGTQGKRRELVIFDDSPYLMDDPRHLARLEAALLQKTKGDGSAALIIHADRHVEYGTLVQLLDMARKLGIRAVDLSTRDPDKARGGG